MGEIINTNTAIETQPGGDTGALLDITQSLLADARIALNSSGVLSVPIAELSTLGAGVSSLIPALNTVTQTTSIAADGLYAIANAGVGDVLKAAKNGNFWASLKTADGASKMVQLQEAGAITATTQTAAAFNPATMMMAVALFSIEQELGEIEDEKSKYGWEFLFLGANIDAVETAKHFGISEDRAVNYHSDSVGTRLNYEVVSCAITSMRRGAPMSGDWKAPIEADYKTRKGEKN